MKFIPRTYFAITLIFFAIVTCSINKLEACINAVPSDYTVKNQDGDLIASDSENSNFYTVPAGTTLTFEVSAAIVAESDSDELVCEWYNSDVPQNGSLVAVLSWWWWTSDGKNPNASTQAPEQTNTPNAPANNRKGGLYALKQTFNKVTPPDTFIEVTAILYPNLAGVTECPSAVVTFFVQVTGTPDQNPPNLTPGPTGTEVTVGIADRVTFNINATDSEDNLQAIEWYVEGFELPLRANGVNTLNTFFNSSNNDSFTYRFKEAGTFELTVAAYDDFLNVSTHMWNITVEEPRLARALPSAAEISVKPEDGTVFKVLVNREDIAIDGVCWQNGQEPVIYMPIAEASLQGNFLAFDWDTSFDFGTIGSFFETVEVTATAYTEDSSGTKTLTGNTVAWIVRAERHVDNSRDLTFCGLQWKVKQSNPLNATIGPGNNYFHSDNVSVDSEGLHLKITQSDDSSFSSAELFTVNSMPRGIYRFYLEGGSGTRLDQLDPQVIFSPFFYSDDTREIDIEFSNWPNSDIYGPGQLQYVVQPISNESLNRFGLNLDNSEDASGKITCQIDWQDDRVIFKSWSGHSASPPEEGVLLSENWIYAEGFIPDSGDELKLHLNLYLKNNRIPNQNNSPDNGMDVHVVVKAIDHPASWEGWRIEKFGERHTFSTSAISNAQDDPDLDYCPNLLEYALGGEPWEFDQDRQPLLSIYQDLGSQRSYLHYIFAGREASPYFPSDSQRVIHRTPFLDYYIKSKSDLADAAGDWVNEPMILMDVPNDLFDGTEMISYRTENTIDETSQKFLQLQVEARDL